MSPPSSESPPSTEPIAGKYELTRLIGRGGMGSVWEGKHTSLGTLVAIKFIDSDHAHNAEAKKRFFNEARAASTIQSKHAIQIFDHGETNDGKPYIVMELLEGEALDKRLERLGSISLPETTRILQQVSRALSRAHDRGIVHRDLKPENIFLVKSPDEDDEIAKVLDFGIAKIRPSPGEASLTSGTKTGAILGTPFYMSPEQARGLREVDHRTDLWSLGAIAYKCVTGTMAFDGQSVGDLLVKICTAPLPVPSALRRDLPAQFDAWFARAMEREPDARFQNVQELCDALAIAAGVSTRIVGAGARSSSGTSTPAPSTVDRSLSSDAPLAAAATVASNTEAPYTTGVREGTAKKNRVLVASIAFGFLGLGVIVATVAVLSLQKDRGVQPEPAGLVDSAAKPFASAIPSAVEATKEAIGAPSTAEATPAETAPPVASKLKPGGKANAVVHGATKPAPTQTAKAPPSSSGPPKKPTKPSADDPGY